MAKLPDLPTWSQIRKSARVEAGLDLTAFKDPNFEAVGDRHWFGRLGRTYVIQGISTRPTWAWKSHESAELLDAVGNAIEPYGYSVPRIVADFNAGSHHRKHRIIVREYINGMALDMRLHKLTPQKRVHVYREMGSLLGLLHKNVPAQAAPYHDHDWNIPPNPFTARRQLIYLAPQYGWDKRKTRAVNRMVDIIERDRENDGPDAKVFRFVHSDWAERNLISAPDGKIRGPVDFELSTQSRPYTEWANLSTFWPQDVPHVLSGYNKITGMSVQPHEVFACKILQAINFGGMREPDPEWVDNALTDNALEWARVHPRLNKRERQTFMNLD